MGKDLWYVSVRLLGFDLTRGPRTIAGDVMHLSVLGRSIIVLSSASAISGLLDKRSIHYSDRPVIPMAGEM